MYCVKYLLVAGVILLGCDEPTPSPAGDSGVDAARADAPAADAPAADASVGDSRAWDSTADGPSMACASGYVPADGMCVDIDECSQQNGGCHTHATCVNTQGGRRCTCNAGFFGDGVACSAMCVPSCTGRVCGDDGCGGSCGRCTVGTCESGACRTPFARAGVMLSVPREAFLFGASVAVSRDGTTLAVGAPGSGGLSGGGGSGRAYVFQRRNAAWQLVASLTANTQGSGFGHTVALSSDGQTLAVGNPAGGYASTMRRGTVHVFRATDGAWNASQTPFELQRQSNHNGFGASLAINTDGGVIAVGSLSNGILVYRRTGSGYDTGSEALDPNLNQSFLMMPETGALSINARGDRIVAVGINDPGRIAPFVRGLDNGWTNMGTVVGALLGGVLSADDSWIVAASATGLRVYQRITETATLRHEYPIAGLGPAVATSADGGTIAVGNYGSGGSVAVFERGEDVRFMGNLIRPTNSNQFGRSVAVSADGSTVVAGDANGGPVAPGNSSGYGQVTVFLR